MRQRRIQFILPFLLIVFAILAFHHFGPAYSQNGSGSGNLPEDSCTRDSFFPESGNCGYEIAHYDIAFEWDDRTNILSADVRLLVNVHSDMRELPLDFTNRFAIQEISVDEIIAAFSQTEENLFVEGDFSAGETAAIRIRYTGLAEEVMILLPNQPAAAGTQPFCLVNEPNLAAAWFPANDHPKDKATFSTRITVPARYAAASNGRLISILLPGGETFTPPANFTMEADDSAEGTVTYTYEMNDPMAPYLYTVCVDSFNIEQQTFDDGVVQLDFLQKDLKDYETFRQWTDLSQEMIACFEPLLGKYPYRDSGSVVLNRAIGGALENQTRSVYGNESIYVGETIFAHEISHQWIGNAVSIADWSDLWIKEGFAMYAEALWEKCAGRTEIYETLLKDFYSVIANAGINILDAEAFSDMVSEKDELPEALLTDKDSIRQGLELICGESPDETVNEEIEASLAEDPLTEEAFWKLVPQTCRSLVMEPAKETRIREFFGFSADESWSETGQIGPKAITNDFDDMYGYEPYYGGALVYIALNDRLGDERFAEAMQTIVERYTNSVINTEEFIQVFSEVAGEDLSEWISRWLVYRTVPDLPGRFTYQQIVDSFD